MRKVFILTLLVCLTFVFLGGCIVVKNSKITSGMSKDEQDKFADQVACKVVEKLKAEQPKPRYLPPGRMLRTPAPGMPGMGGEMTPGIQPGTMPGTPAPAAEPNKPCK
jgi:hypothetical protein